jgi:hypothetical protein
MHSSWYACLHSNTLTRLSKLKFDFRSDSSQIKHFWLSFNVHKILNNVLTNEFIELNGELLFRQSNIESMNNKEFVQS